MSAARTTSTTSVLDGKYALLRELGKGATGKVYEAEHLIVGKHLAIKVMSAAMFANPNYRTDFVAEARAAARIAHANVVDIHDFGVTSEGVPYLVMELLRGETLEDILSARGPLSPSYACELMLQVLAGLSAAHAQGIVHCDLKPANIMVTHPRPDRPLVKVLDFGIAHTSTDAPRDVLLGTPMFMAPEQVLGTNIDRRTDLYAAAAMLYTMLAGHDPYEGPTPKAVFEQIVNGKVQPLSDADGQIPKTLAFVIELGMAVDAKKRIQSAEEFAEMLRPFIGLSGAAVSFRPEHPILSHPIPLVAPIKPALHADDANTPPSSRTPSEIVAIPRGVRIEASSPPISTTDSLPVAAAPHVRTVSDSLLVAPRIPPPPTPPKLKAGRDFIPLQGAPGPGSDAWARALPTRVPRSLFRHALPALIATVLGFGFGIVLAWIAGLI